MKSKKIFLLSILIPFLSIILTACTNNQSINNNDSKSMRIDSTPTFFFHGYGSSINAEKQMVNAAKNAGVTDTILTAIVDNNGKVNLSGTISKKSKNPIIMVGYMDNRNPDYNTDAKYAYNVIKTVKSHYRFKKMNLVGHSMGNMDIMFMLLNYGQNKDFPILNKQVDIAGHFNGIRGYDDTAYSRPNSEGKPDKMNQSYQELLKLRKTYPVTASVLNIYGDKLDGTHSDGPVTIYSSRTLKYLVSTRAKHYEERMIKGKNAQHSQLHENKEVDRLLIKFLWNK